LLPPVVDANEEKWRNSLDNKKSNTVLQIVYSGVPGRNKDKINLLIDLIYRIHEKRKFILNIIGVTKEQFLESYPTYINKLDALDGIIYFQGRVSHNESLEYLKTADVSCFIRNNNKTTKAGFPTKFVESITCGTPVITTNTSDLHKYLVEGVNGFFIDDNLSSETVTLWEKLFIKEQNIIFRMKRNFDTKIFHYERYDDSLSNFIELVVG